MIYSLISKDRRTFNMDTTNDIYTVHDDFEIFLKREQKWDLVLKIFKAQGAASRVAYIEELLLHYNRIPNLVLRQKKSDDKALQLRNEGNKYFEAKNYYYALHKYNKSICFAESSENIAIAFGNRSAVYYDMQLYSQCLEH